MINFFIKLFLSLATFFSFCKAKNEAKELKEELEKETRKNSYLQQQNTIHINRKYPSKKPIKIDCVVCDTPFETIEETICKSCKEKIQYLQHSEPTKN